MIEIKSPNITGEDHTQTLLQMRSYLYQLSGQLNWAFSTLENPGDSESGEIVLENSKGLSSEEKKQQEVLDNFNDLKGLIIKSAEIVESYYDAIKTRLDGVYVAESEFGTYREEVSREIVDTARGEIDRYDFTSILQPTNDKLGQLNTHLNGMIQKGLIEDEDGVMRMGIVIGDDIEVERYDENGNAVFNKSKTCAFYRSDKVVFYVDGYEAAYISNQKLHIREADVEGKFTLNGWEITDGSIGLTFRYAPAEGEI